MRTMNQFLIGTPHSLVECQPAFPIRANLSHIPRKIQTLRKRALARNECTSTNADRSDALLETRELLRGVRRRRIFSVDPGCFHSVAVARDGSRTDCPPQNAIPRIMTRALLTMPEYRQIRDTISIPLTHLSSRAL